MAVVLFGFFAIGIAPEPFLRWEFADAHGGRRAMLVGLSFAVLGGMTLGLCVAGPKNTGRVIAWVGTAMFAALALGAPVGSLLFDRLGFSSIAAATILVPFASMLAVKFLPASEGRPPVPGSVLNALKMVWLPGLGAVFNGVGFAALVVFAVLVFEQNHWLPIPHSPTFRLVSRGLLSALCLPHTTFKSHISGVARLC